MEPFSVLMSIYKNDCLAQVIQAIESIAKNQTVLPSEVVIVEDGPIADDIELYLSNCTLIFNIPFLILKLPVNRGLGNALNAGLSKCSFSLIARMDSDDISYQDRFERQLKLFSDDPSLDVVGGYVTEFIENPNNIVGKRKVPCTAEEISRYIILRSPINHPTVMFKKQAIIEAEGYIEIKFVEDYFLWVRLWERNCKIQNLDSNLVNMRVSSNLYKRRGGWLYYSSFKQLYHYMYSRKLISTFQYLRNLIIRFCSTVVISNNVRKVLYIRLLRRT